MKIQGNLATYELSDLLQWLAQGNKTGVLTVTNGDVEYKLGFDHGRIDMSSSNDPGQCLDSYLHRKGVIDGATLARAERLRDATKMMSGQVLVTLGAVTEPQLAQALREKTEEILCELLTWDRGTFEFEGGDRPASTMVPINLEVTKLLLESMHRLDQRRGGQPEPRPEAPPAATPVRVAPEQGAPVAAGPVRPDDTATQAIEGLALAEVLDPESPPEAATGAGVGPGDEAAIADVPPSYAVMQQGPGTVRRLAPFAAVALLSLTATAFYLANREASAQAADAGASGPPIVFTQTAGPPPPPAPLPLAVSGPSPAATVTPEAPVSEAEIEEALRQRYEQQLAELRRELEETRRLAQATPQTPRAAAAPGDAADLPADSIMRAAVARPEPLPPPVEPVDRPAAKPEPAAPAAVPRPPEPAVTQPPAPAAAPAAEPEATAGAEIRPLQLVNPSLISRPAPRYPMAALRHGRGATVTLRVLVGADGNVQEVERVGGKAGMGFDRAAEDAARASTWKPGTRDGEPTEMWAELRFEFKP